MHERFSDRARHAMALANREAGTLGHAYIAPAHIMLGLIAEGHCVATEALKILDVDLGQLRDKVAQRLGPGSDPKSVGCRAQTKETKEVIALAVKEARKLGHHYVGTEHLALALLACEQSIPSLVLHEHGVEMPALREKVLAMLHSSVNADHDLAHSRHGDFEWIHQQELAKAFRSPGFWHTLVLAVDSANRLGAGEIEPQHLLLALLRDNNGLVCQLLAEKGVTVDWVRERLSAQLSVA